MPLSTLCSATIGKGYEARRTTTTAATPAAATEQNRQQKRQMVVQKKITSEEANGGGEARGESTCGSKRSTRKSTKILLHVVTSGLDAAPPRPPVFQSLSHVGPSPLAHARCFNPSDQNPNSGTFGCLFIRLPHVAIAIAIVAC